MAAEGPGVPMPVADGAAMTPVPPADAVGGEIADEEQDVQVPEDNAAAIAPESSAGAVDGKVAADVVHPQPPYKEGDDINKGIECYYPNCQYIGYTWGSLLKHVRGRQHGQKLSALHGTHQQ